MSQRRRCKAEGFKVAGEAAMLSEAFELNSKWTPALSLLVAVASKGLRQSFLGGKGEQVQSLCDVLRSKRALAQVRLQALLLVVRAGRLLDANVPVSALAFRCGRRLSELELLCSGFIVAAEHSVEWPERCGCSGCLRPRLVTAHS